MTAPAVKRLGMSPCWTLWQQLLVFLVDEDPPLDLHYLSVELGCTPEEIDEALIVLQAKGFIVVVPRNEHIH